MAEILSEWQAVFKAAGLEDLLASVGDLKGKTDGAAESQDRLAKALGDSTFLKAARQLQEQTREADHFRRVTAQQLDLDQRRRAVSSGRYARELRDQQTLARERERVAKLERREELTAKYGRPGGAVMAAAGSRLGTATNYAAGTALGVGAGLVRSGLSDTVESQKLALETKLAGRELAGAFAPAIRAATQGVRRFREILEQATPGQQAGIAAGGLTLAGHFGLRALTGQGLVGWGARLGGAAGGGAAGGGLASFAGNAAGGALGTAAMQKLAGTSAVPVGAGATAAAGRGGLVAAGAKLAGPAAALYSVGQGLGGGYYDDLRAKGNNQVVSTLGALGGGALDLVTFGEFTDYHRKKGRFTGQKSNVTKADAGFDAVGSSYDRLQTSLSMVDTSHERKDQEKKAEADNKPVTDRLDQVIGLLSRLVPGGELFRRT